MVSGRQADEAEARTMLGRPLTEVDSNEGIYIDEEGNVFQLAEKGATKAIEVERSSAERKEAGNRHKPNKEYSPDLKRYPTWSIVSARLVPYSTRHVENRVRPLGQLSQ